MERDTDLLIENHANGIVIGILKDDRTIDATRCKQLVNRAQGREVVFHRAFDLVPDPIRALDELIGLGFTRVLTSGQQATASAGAALIRKLVDYADARIQILPGSGIRPQNVKALLVATGCSQVHATAFRVREDPTTATTHLKFGSTANPSESNYDGSEAELVRELRQAIDRV
jgi:copper homeostasis protein